MMGDSVTESLILDLLEWLVKRDRSYEEVMDAWRTSCPRLPVWEDANDGGLVMKEQVQGRCMVRITSSGLALLEQRRLRLAELSRRLNPGDSSRVDRKGLKHIDVHHHFIPPQNLKEGPPPVAMSKVKNWSPAHAIEDMDRHGIDIPVLSFSSPYLSVLALDKGRRFARLCNDYSAQIVRDYPHRFGLFAGVPPLADTVGCLHEIEYALDELHAQGITVMTSYGDSWLGDRAFCAGMGWVEPPRRRVGAEKDNVRTFIETLSGTAKTLIVTSGIGVFGDTGTKVYAEDTPFQAPAHLAWRQSVENEVLNAKSQDIRSIGAGGATRSWALEEAQQQLGPVTGGISANMRASSEVSKRTLGWQPTRSSILDDMAHGSYAGPPTPCT